jgi:perosamine synthetase
MSEPSSIPQVEPYLTGNEARAAYEYLRSGGWLTEFRQTAKFEQRLGEFLAVPHVVVVTSGTAALYLALLAAGIGPGDRVVVPNYTMIATINAVVWAGATPVLADVEPATLCLDLQRLEPQPKCKALLYVSINGRSGDLGQVKEFCGKNGLVLIEDACQSLGSRWRGQCLGTFGCIGVFSFTPHKIITTGQGGALVTRDLEICQKLKKLKDFHRTAPATDRHDGLGFNFKFTDLQAVVGLEQLKLMDFRVQRKKEIYLRYANQLGGVAGLEMLPTDLTDTTPWFVDIILDSPETRDRLMAYLKQQNIGSRPFYPPVNHQELYAQVPVGAFPVSEGLAPRGLWLPSSVGLEAGDVDRVCEAVEKFCRHG